MSYYIVLSILHKLAVFNGNFAEKRNDIANVWRVVEKEISG